MIVAPNETRLYYPMSGEVMIQSEESSYLVTNDLRNYQVICNGREAISQTPYWRVQTEVKRPAILDNDTLETENVFSDEPGESWPYFVLRVLSGCSYSLKWSRLLSLLLGSCLECFDWSRLPGICFVSNCLVEKKSLQLIALGNVTSLEFGARSGRKMIFVPDHISLIDFINGHELRAFLTPIFIIV